MACVKINCVKYWVVFLDDGMKNYLLGLFQCFPRLCPEYGLWGNLDLIIWKKEPLFFYGKLVGSSRERQYFFVLLDAA